MPGERGYVIMRQTGFRRGLRDEMALWVLYPAIARAPSSIWHAALEREPLRGTITQPPHATQHSGMPTEHQNPHAHELHTPVRDVRL